jgi:predicted permease
MRTLLARCKAVFRKRSLDPSLDDEVQFHIDMQIEENRRNGMTPRQARSEALRSFGGVEQVKEAYRERRGLPFLDSLQQDVRLTLRMLRCSPGFTAVVALTLALGIGSNTAIFSLVYAVLLDPYPYKNADRIVAPAYSDKRVPSGPQARLSRMFYTIPDFLEIEHDSKTLEGAFLADTRTLIATGDIPEQVHALAFSPNSFEFMGVPPMLGRTFTRADIPAPQAPPRLLVLRYLFWQRHFNGDRGVIRKQFELDHQPYTIIGVLPPRFTWNDADVYLPLPMAADYARPISTMMRIKPGLKLEAASAELQAMTERFRERSPNIYPKGDFRFQVQPLNTYLLGKFQGVLLILLVAVGCLLLIACGNVSVLLLARAAARQKEIAVRVSLGAARHRIVRQLLTESILFSVLGGAPGVALAYIGVPLVVALMPAYAVPKETAIHVNGPVVLFSFLIAVITGILFGMAPALQLVKSDVRESIQKTGRSFSGSARANATRSVLIVAEVALTLVLLAGASIAIRGLLALTSTDLGFNPANVLTAEVNLPSHSWNNWATRSAHMNRILSRIESIPGIAAASGTLSAVPPYMGFTANFEIPGRESEGATQKTAVGLITGDYFKALRVPLLRGQMFSDSDTMRARRVGVINEAMARRYWPAGDPIGVKIRIPILDLKGNPDVLKPPDAAEPIEIAGVVANIRNQGLTQPAEPAIYVPWTLLSPPGMLFMVRATGDPNPLINPVREAVRAEDPDQPVGTVVTLEERLRVETAYPRFSTTLFGIFAGVALLLSVCGLYSVVSYAVARRTQEFGIRMALGARTPDVLRIVVGAIMRLTIIGIVLGLGCTFMMTRVISAYVTGWNPKDPLAFVMVIAALLGAALAASVAPALRAVSIQPISALRHD